MGNNYQGNGYMKKTSYSIMQISLFLIGVIAACSFFTTLAQKSTSDTVPPTPTGTSTPSPTATSTVTPLPPTETPVPTATKLVTLVPAAPTEPVPICELSDTPSQSQCQYPIAEQSSAFCIKKSPYNLIFLNDSATYEVLHEHIQCSEAGVKDGQRMVTCTGPMAQYFELKVCDSACSGLEIEQEASQCPLGYNYNNLQNCCTQETQEVDQGCAVLKLNTKSCVIDCGQFTKSSSCTNYGYACRWDNTTSKCLLRK